MTGGCAMRFEDMLLNGLVLGENARRDGDGELTC